MEFQRLDDLGVAEIQHVFPLLDDSHLGAQRGEHRGILDADHAGTDHDHRGRERLEVQNPVGVQDPLFVEFDAGRPGRPGAGGDHDVIACDSGLFAARLVFDHDGVRIDEPAVPHQQVDPVAHQLIAYHVDFLADHMLGPGQQIGRGDPVLDTVARPVEFALIHAGEVEHRLAQRLRWDGAGVDADAAQHSATLDDRNGFAQLGRGNGRLLAARPRAENHHVVLAHRPHEIDSRTHSGDFVHRIGAQVPDVRTG
ncbi:hypothetical protein LAUMK7_02354 [Mycobacterium kansasii]|nr:hypothetical protein LAUMK22_01723 [Mycobacterium kansasii]VAZ74392.1 hypothetical protein LAUMK7_02354 [Mycobacterium kansasii]